MKEKKNIGINILIASLAISGLISITTGAVLNKNLSKKDNKKIDIKVVQKQVAKIKSNIPELKEITLEVNQPLSVNIEDYIDNLDDIEDKILKKLKLDTSLVNVTQAGKYTYTVNYKDKTYNGIININEKQLPIIENIILKDISIEKGKTLPTDISAYITTSIPEELKPSIKINTNKVNINIAGNYQYTVTYNNKIYTGMINIYEPQNNEIETKLTLKEITIEKDTALPTDVSHYITENISTKVKENAKLDVSKVDNKTAGKYEYTITYNKTVYSGNIIIIEKSTQIVE